MDSLIHRELGPYRIVGSIGRGGMASVYKAYDPIHRHVALKILPHRFAEDPAFIKRFKQEAQVIAQLEHINIVPVYGFGETDGYTYLAMRLVETGTLSDLIQPENLPILSEVERIISQVGSALDYAHSRKIIHRDVKPANILLDDSNNCLLSDFGIAKMLEGTNTSKITETNTIIGTPAYMSPEQIQGQELDGRSDLYSLGIILYQMVTGQPPYKANTLPALCMHHLYTPLPMPREYNPNLPKAVEQVIVKSLAKERDKRYKSCKEMVEALQLAISNLSSEEITRYNSTLSIPKPTTDPIPKKFNWIEYLAIPSIVIIVLLVASLFSRINGGTPPKPILSPDQTETITTTVGDTQVLTNKTPSPSPSHPSGIIAFAAYAPQREAYEIHFINADGSNHQVYPLVGVSEPALRHTEQGYQFVYRAWSEPTSPRSLITSNLEGNQLKNISDFWEDAQPDWSPKENRIIFASQRESDRHWRLYTVWGDGSAETNLQREGRSPTFAPDGYRFAFESCDRSGKNCGLWLGDLDHSTEKAKPFLLNSSAKSPDWHPTSETLAYTSLDEDNENWDIYLIDSDGTNGHRLTTDPTVEGNPAWSPDGKWLAFLSNRDNNWGIWLLNVETREVQSLITIDKGTLIPPSRTPYNEHNERSWWDEQISWAE